MKSKAILILTGAGGGFLNGLFGSGGGSVTVPLLEKAGLEQKKAHATAVAVIFCFSVVSVIVYALKGSLDLSGAMAYIPWGIPGSVLGAFILKKIENNLLRRIFGFIIIISAIRMLFA